MATRLDKIREWLEQLSEWLDSAGLGPGWLDRVLIWWKHFGLLRTSAILVAVFLPLFKFVVVPQMASFAVATVAEGYGWDIEVGDWGANILDLRTTAYDVVVRTSGLYSSDEILKASSITADLSFWGRITRGFWTNEIVFNEPEIFVERLHSGRWNIEDLLALGLRGQDRMSTPPDFRSAGRVDLETVEATYPAIQIPRIEFEDLKFQWLENLPAGSGSGLIQSLQESLFLDDVAARISDFISPIDRRDEASEMALEGRLADGRISISGAMNLFHWGLPENPSSQPILVDSRTETGSWFPQLSLNLYLENVGAGAVGRMVPLASLQPTSGSITGNIGLSMRDGQVICEADLTLIDVGYAVNSGSPAVRGRAGDLQRELAGYRANQRVQANCGGQLGDETYRPHYCLQAAVTRQAVSQAGPSARATSEWDWQQFGGSLASFGLDALRNTLIRKGTEGISRMAGPEVGNSMSQALQESNEGDSKATESKENPVSRGLKGAGQGLKRLFGGGKKKKPPQ